MRKEKVIMVAFKVFFIGLLLQFFLNTFVTFKLGIDNSLMSVIWSWKEILVIIGGIVALYYMYKDKTRKKKNTIRYMFIAFCVLMIYVLIDTYLKGIGLVWFAKAWKYDLIGFMIFFITYYLCTRVPLKKIEAYIPWFTRVMKTLLVRGIIWYMMLLIKPGALKLFGYDRLSIEGEVGQRPPAVYRTREFEGLPRNQFLFERPISRGFFLTAFFPLFFVQYLQRKSLKKTWFWRGMYGLNIIFTYSRAARGSWVIELALLGIISYRKHIGVFLKKVLVPAIIVLAGITRLAKDQVINREYSNTGHVQLLKQGRDYFSQNWLVGMGAGSVGPASHWVGGLNFNPENQFLQIAIEFGIIGFILWMVLFVRYHLLGYNILRKEWKHKHFSESAWNMIAMSIGILGLSISGLVLHSFTDRMIVYPFMLVFGIVYYIHKHTLHIEKGAK